MLFRSIEGPGLNGIPLHRYRPMRGSTQGIHPWASDFETKILRGEACAGAADKLTAQGFHPDVIVSNPGWGESLFLKDVWPGAKVLELLEFFYSARGLDADFDPEFNTPTPAQAARLRAKNAYLLMAMHAMDAGMSPTYFQHGTLPAQYRNKVSVVFDGIDTTLVKPDTNATLTVNGHAFRAGDEIGRAHV